MFLKNTISIATTVFVTCTFFKSVSANEVNAEKISVNVKEFSIQLDRSRLIYKREGSGGLFTVENTHNYPMLIQTKLTSENKKDLSDDFLPTPPLFRLNAGQKSKVRIYPKKAIDTKIDREELYWICVRGIAPSNNDIWDDLESENTEENSANLKVNLSVENCIKMIVRPKNVSPIEYKFGNELKFERINDGVKIKNPTPHYINLKNLSIDGARVNVKEYIAPFSDINIETDVHFGSIAEWILINDAGGETQKHSIEIN